MSTRHDARLAPVAGGAWVAALVATGGSSTGAVVGFLTVTLGAGVALLAVTSTARARRMSSYAAELVRAGAAVCLLMGTVGALVATVAGVKHHSHTTRGDQLVAAGATDAWITVEGQGASMRGFDGSERWRVVATVTAWRPHCTGDRQCEPWQAARVPVTVVLDSRLSRGVHAQITGNWDESDWAPQVAMSWQAQHIRDGPQGTLSAWRERFAEATQALSPQVRGLVQGMAVGDTSDMPESQERHMRVAGLAHLTAVSGAHFAILVMTSASVLGAMRAPRVVRGAAVLVMAVTFAAVVGPDPSVVRALAMACAVSLALVWGRPARGLAALLVGVTVLLIIDPWLARSLGFAMSVLAVAAIVLWSPRIAAMAAGVVTPGLARVLSIPIAAQAAVTPLLIVMEPGIGPYAVLANLIAGLVVLPTMLACAATLAAAAVSVPLAALLAPVAGFFANGIAYVARVTAQAPGAWIPWPAEVPGIALATGVTALMILITVRMRLQYRLAAGILAISLIGAATSYADPARAEVPADWHVAACDVGQGDMLLLRAGPNSAVVVDTGPPDQGAEDCLRRHRIGRVPLLVLTHPHLDHDGAVADVAQVARIDQAWVSRDGWGGSAAAVAQAAGAEVRVPAAGERFDAGDVSVTVVSDRHEEIDQGENDASIIVRAQASDTSVMALGDLEVAGQRALLARLDVAEPIDVVKVAHHGSAQQFPALIEALGARVALVSAGADNRHGHPAPSALELYGDNGAAVLRTDTCGDLHVGTVSGQLRWSQCP